MASKYNLFTMNYTSIRGSGRGEKKFGASQKIPGSSPGSPSKANDATGHALCNIAPTYVCSCTILWASSVFFQVHGTDGSDYDKGDHFIPGNAKITTKAFLNVCSSIVPMHAWSKYGISTHHVVSS